MSRIRDDLEGVVIVATDGNPIVLKAGDDIPDGVEVGDHVKAGDDKKPAARK